MAWYIWLGIAVLLIIIEFFTFDLVSIWFAISSLVLTVVSALFPSLSIAWQLLIFVALTALLLLLTRNVVKKFTAKRKGMETNLDLIINHTAKVIEKIDNVNEEGAVKINGLIWNARSKNGNVINDNEYVIVNEIKGNKLIVSKKEED